jgi:hypothetical protein
LVFSQFVERIDVFLKAGVVDEDVEAAELLQGLLNGAGAEFRIANVAADQQAFPSFLLNRLPGALGILILFQVDNRNIGAFARVQHGDAAPDAAVTAGDDRNLALELPRAEIVRRVVKGLGIELVFVPGLRLMLLGKGQFRVAPRSRLHRPFVVRLLVLGMGAIAIVNSGLNTALLITRACGGFFHRCSPLVF